jgi:hypothetical protein
MAVTQYCTVGDWKFSELSLHRKPLSKNRFAFPK